ncbi:hypothetical protein [Microseira sp. BLCC-F43]|jgi:hypothetical protein|uniref:hypothetical protein n=1 Tax=Microseira sp. BLCC-F43 TaxID=3153602 RepID=UPI0035B7521B
MKAIATTVIVTADGKITLQLPPDIPPGEHQVVLVIDEQPAPPELVTKKERPPLNFPVDSYGSWPADLSLKREDMYD